MALVGFGDGTSTSITVDLTDAPTQSINGQALLFKTNSPVSVVLLSSMIIGSNGRPDPTITVTISIMGTKLIYTFSSPPVSAPAPFVSPIGEFVITCFFLYHGD